MQRLIRILTKRLQTLLARNAVEADLEREIELHVEQLYRQHVADGLSESEARLAARREFGSFEATKESCREMRRMNLFEDLIRDLRHALRTLRKNKVFATVAILSLAMGIGANTAIFSLIDVLLLRPLPVEHPEQLVRLAANTGRPVPRSAVTDAIFERLRDWNTSFSGTFTWADHQFQVRSGTDMVHVDGVFASGSYFRALGVAAAHGRVFTENNDKPGGGSDGPVVVINDRFWSDHYQRNPAAIGSAIQLDGVQFTIIGVARASFFGADVATKPQLWVPLSLAAKTGDAACLSSRSCWWLVVMARLKPGISLQQAQADLRVLSPRLLADSLPATANTRTRREVAKWRLIAVPGANGWTSLRQQFSNPLAVMMILVGIVLLVACANLANLLLSRSYSRQREVAIRLAIGANRWRVVRQLLTESILLSLLGGIGGLGLALWSTRLFVAFIASAKRAAISSQNIDFDLHPDWRLLVFSLIAALACGLLFGLVPALRGTRVGLSGSLKDRAHSLRGDGTGMRPGRIILSLQAALSVILVAGAGLFGDTLWRLRSLDPGFNPKGVAVIAVDTDKHPSQGAARIQLYGRLLQQIHAIPGVSAASVVWIKPLSNGGWDDDITIPGRTDLTEEQRDTYMNLVGPEYFKAMQTPLLRGRDFSPADTQATEKVGILNEIAAQRFFPNREAVGSHVEVNKSLIRIVGVVGNAKYQSLQERDPATLYFPFTQATGDVPSMNFIVRTSTGISSIYPAFYAAVHQIAPDAPVGTMKTMEEQLNDSLGKERLLATLSVFFGALALLLTSVGLYGVLSYAVVRRSAEIGVRMALGAQQGDVILLILRETIGHVGFGILAGVVTVLMTSKLVANLLYGIEPNDKGNLMVAIGLFLVVAAAAAYFPARRSTRLDPLLALRDE